MKRFGLTVVEVGQFSHQRELARICTLFELSMKFI